MQIINRRRLLWLLGTLVALLSLLLVLELFEWMGTNNLQARFNRIENGMTINEVENLVGAASFPPSPRGNDGLSSAMWCIPDQCAFRVWFDKDGKVINKELCEGNLNRKASLNDLMNEFLRRIGY